MNQGYYNNGYNNNPYYNNQNPNMYPNRMMPNNMQRPVNGGQRPMNNGNMPKPQKPKSSNSSKKMLPLIIVAGVLGLILVILFIVLLVTVVFNKGTDEPKQDPQPSITEKTIKVGTATHGYVEVPSDWVSFYDTSVTDTTLIQYSSQDKKYIISIGYFADDQTDPKKAASQLALNFKNSNATDLKAWDNITVGSYTGAYKVQGKYDDGVILAGYFFQTPDGLTRCVMIEGPDTNNSAFAIPYTFTLAGGGTTSTGTSGTIDSIIE